MSDTNKPLAITVTDVDDKGNFDVLEQIIKALKRNLDGDDDVSFMEWTVGLKMLLHHKKEEEHDRLKHLDTSIALKASDVTKSVGFNLLHFVNLVKATYSHAPLEKCPTLEILIHEAQSRSERPAYFLAYDSALEAVVLGIRGTASLRDVLTDLTNETTPFKGGYAHKGMLSSGQWFVNNLVDEVQGLMKKHKTRKFFVVGHSLGAGTAALTTLLFKDHISTTKCVCFAPPAVLSPALAEKFQKSIISIIYRYDIVPRIQPYTMHLLRAELIEYPWEQEITRGFTNSEIVKLAGRGLTDIDRKLKLSAFAKRVAKSTSRFIPNFDGEDSDNEVDEAREYEELLPPGDTLYMEQDLKGQYYLFNVENQYFNHILLNTAMLNDHKMDNYGKGIMDIFDPIDYDKLKKHHKKCSIL